MIIRSPAVCLAIGAAAAVFIVAFMVINGRHERRRLLQQYRDETAGFTDEDWRHMAEFMAGHASDITRDVPQDLYDGLPEDQITDEER